MNLENIHSDERAIAQYVNLAERLDMPVKAKISADLQKCQEKADERYLKDGIVRIVIFDGYSYRFFPKSIIEKSDKYKYEKEHLYVTGVSRCG